MSPALEHAVVEREKQHEQYKLAERGQEPLTNVDYDAFRKRLAAGLALQDDKKEHWTKEDPYLKYKAERAARNAIENKPETQNREENE